MRRVKDKVETKQLLKYLIVFFLGGVVQGIVYELRFNNELLRQEFILVTANGISGYFLALASLNLIGIMFFGIWLLLIIRKEKRTTKESKR